ncbi:hypothetical protein [Listeria grayi]|uniref:Uncharacterized protein n=2 Tax=Listeria grayi TaxID=1641 RepID=D7UZB2_LISGR|nr:hypothetical protein [Listeria grayi]EFI83679.1 hypothetical protein HMPREF0556_12364 [Listeria grayi DSM 20601]STY43238.1 Uncharacterised protein [Listeria grayi]
MNFILPRKRKLLYTGGFLLILILSLVTFVPSAYAMESKGSSRVAFHTDANTYSKKATTIVVRGKATGAGVQVSLMKKGSNKILKYISVQNKETYKVSFSLKGLKSGKYDIIVNGEWGYGSFHAELKHYLTVIR